MRSFSGEGLKSGAGRPAPLPAVGLNESLPFLSFFAIVTLDKVEAARQVVDDTNAASQIFPANFVPSGPGGMLHWLPRPPPPADVLPASGRPNVPESH